MKKRTNNPFLLQIGFAMHHTFIFVLAVALSGGMLQATPLETDLNKRTAINNHSRQSQRKVEVLDDETQSCLDEYRVVYEELQQLNTYNNNLKKMVVSQEEESKSLRAQIEAIEETKQNILPLIGKMNTSLEEFVNLDIPFLPRERNKRLVSVKETIEGAKSTLVEKYRRLLDAYQVELSFGRTLEAYRAELTNDKGTRTVDFLRLGRLGLFYQSLDQQETGYFHPSKKAWIVLPEEFHSEIRKGLRVARKEIPPQLLILPLVREGAVQ